MNDMQMLANIAGMTAELIESGELVRVVRCKDCKHYDEETGRCALRHVHGCAETWFCADGERKAVK